jgi:hypothetical protein
MDEATVRPDEDRHPSAPGNNHDSHHFCVVAPALDHIINPQSDRSDQSVSISTNCSTKTNATQFRTVPFISSIRSIASPFQTISSHALQLSHNDLWNKCVRQWTSLRIEFDVFGDIATMNHRLDQGREASGESSVTAPTRRPRGM